MDVDNGNDLRIEVPKNSGAYVHICGDGGLVKEETEQITSRLVVPPLDEHYGVSSQEKQVLEMLMPPSPELPYPLKELAMWKGMPALEYVIPEEDREEVFRQVYPFKPCPSLDEYRYDLHADREFIIREYRVIRELDRNLLVSPYYPESGGMVVDWMDTDNKNTCIHRV